MRKIHDYFTRGYRRPRNRLPPTRGEAVWGCEGLFAQFFLEDNNYVLVEGNFIGQRLHKVARDKGILLMGCDQCCFEREIADKLFDGVPIGCFPNLYKALSGNMPDQVITL